MSTLIALHCIAGRGHGGRRLHGRAATDFIVVFARRSGFLGDAEGSRATALADLCSGGGHRNLNFRLTLSEIQIKIGPV